LSLNIVPSGNQPWDSSFSYGPAWYATYTAPTDGSSPPADAVVGSSDSDKLISIFYKAGQLTAGGMAAAIVVPLIVVAIALGIYIRKLHLNRNNKTADWADHMDNRMSKISLDWTSGGDGQAGPTPGSRPASFLSARPQSSYRPSVDAVRAQYAASLAGQGAGSTEHGSGREEMSEVGRESLYAASAGQSNNRVSFAQSTAAGHASAGHQPSSLRAATNNPRSSLYKVTKGGAMAPLDTQQLPRDANDETDDDNYLMSPEQSQGATPLNFEVLRKSMDDDVRKSMMNYPALEMMDGQDDEDDDEGDEVMKDAVQEQVTTSPSSHLEQEEEEDDDEAYATDSGVVSDQTGMLPPSSAGSPDEALKQYASLRAAAASTPTGSSSAPMRNLYGNQPTLSSNSITTRGGSSINEDDVVGYNEMISGNPHQ
jgi:hypothetical protein